jgi:hypothetical protein
MDLLYFKNIEGLTILGKYEIMNNIILI